MRVVIVDNKDSFTYNLAHYVEFFVEYVDVFRIDRIKSSDLASYDNIILSPGPGLPKEYPMLYNILADYYHSKSILGVCLGHQAIAEFFHAKLINLSKVKHGESSLVYHNQRLVFNNLPVPIKVGHYHSWVVSEDNFPDCLEITSKNENGIITSFAHKKYNIQGLQFHPESIMTDYGLDIIRNWLS